MKNLLNVIATAPTWIKVLLALMQLHVGEIDEIPTLELRYKGRHFSLGPIPVKRIS